MARVHAVPKRPFGPPLPRDPVPTPPWRRVGPIRSRTPGAGGGGSAGKTNKK